jgi:hypothetical protein
MFVFAQVSSMKINHPAAAFFWCRFHCRRRRATSARFRSLARTVHAWIDYFCSSNVGKDLTDAGLGFYQAHPRQTSSKPWRQGVLTNLVRPVARMTGRSGPLPVMVGAGHPSTSLKS